MKRLLLITFLTLTISLPPFAQHRGEYTTDVLGNKTYRDGAFEETFSIDIFGNNQYKNNQDETASLEKDIMGNMIYKDSRGNRITIDQKNWLQMLDRAHGDREGLFSYFISKNSRKHNSVTQYETDLMGHDIFSSDGQKEEIWQDILGDWQYTNNNGTKASLSKNVLGEYIYNDSRGSRITFSPQIWERKLNKSHNDPAMIFRDLIHELLK